ncbi:MAG: UDP-3-O-acyl-N-acetylglucosamine deacetylase [Synergistaceae bacterium]|nr:UDP-3-O-acyl-N-acetylglucosamine deacetylase [Synergistaceae bacterium]
MNRRLNKTVSWEGTGLHSGSACKVTLSPSDELSLTLNGARVPIKELKFEGSSRGTDLIFPDGAGAKKVRTVEHLLSAIGGLGLWGTNIEVEGTEIPALDGCSETFARKLLESSEENEPVVKPLEIHSPVCCAGAGGAFITAAPAEKFSVTYIIKYENNLIGTSLYDYEDGGDYIKEISRARTFALEKDIKKLMQNGMALGGSLENAILVGETEIQTNGGLRYADEFARHKVLDLIGDLALLGRPVCAKIVAIRAGHLPHLQFVEKLRRLS